MRRCLKNIFKRVFAWMERPGIRCALAVSLALLVTQPAIYHLAGAHYQRLWPSVSAHTISNATIAWATEIFAVAATWYSVVVPHIVTVTFCALLFSVAVREIFHGIREVKETALGSGTRWKRWAYVAVLTVLTATSVFHNLMPMANLGIMA